MELFDRMKCRFSKICFLFWLANHFNKFQKCTKLCSTNFFSFLFPPHRTTPISFFIKYVSGPLARGLNFGWTKDEWLERKQNIGKSPDIFYKIHCMRSTERWVKTICFVNNINGKKLDRNLLSLKQLEHWEGIDLPTKIEKTPVPYLASTLSWNCPVTSPSGVWAKILIGITSCALNRLHELK